MYQRSESAETSDRASFEREFDHELPVPALSDEDDGSRAFRGLMIAVALSTPFWIALFLLLHYKAC